MALQPRGHVVLVGCSVAGCTIAAAMAAALQTDGRLPLLILLDGCPAPLSATALHDPAWWVAHLVVALIPLMLTNEDTLPT